MTDDEVLTGGVANAGSVVRRGSHVLRPSNPHTPSIHAYLRFVRAAGFEGASAPIEVDAQGREVLAYIPGDVGVPPYPAWVRGDAALQSIARLLRGLHDAAVGFESQGHTWSDEMADPEGGSIVVHNDVCLENVVFRDGEAIGLVDFDFAAPGRPEHDVAAMARMCVPVDDPVNAARLGWEPADLPGRLRAVVDAYGLDQAGRAEVLSALDRSIASGGAFVQRRIEAGDQNFIEMVAQMGGMERFDRRRRWWAVERAGFARALR